MLPDRLLLFGLSFARRWAPCGRRSPSSQPSPPSAASRSPACSVAAGPPTGSNGAKPPAPRPPPPRLKGSEPLAAPPDTLEPLVANLQLWTTWSPWERADPTLQRIYGGPDSGAGANYFWWGGGGVGRGGMSVVPASAAEVRVRMEIEKPRRRTSDFEFRLVAQDKGTRVTWIAVCENDRAGTLRELLE